MYRPVVVRVSSSRVSTNGWNQTRALSFFSSSYQLKQVTLEQHIWNNNGLVTSMQKRSENRNLSSFSNKLWDMVQSGSFNPENPLIETATLLTKNDDDTIIDFSRIRPHHLVEAATHIQSDYELELSKLEDEVVVKSGACNDQTFIEKLHTISFPLYFIENVLHLLSNVQTDSVMFKSCSEALRCINFRHETSLIIIKQLQEIQTKVKSSSSDLGDDTSEELHNMIERLLLRSKNRGFTIDSNPVVRGEETMDNETIQNYLNETEKRIRDTESKFVSLSQLTSEKDGRSASPKDLLPLMYEILMLKGAKAKLMGFDSYGEFCFKSSSNRRMVKEYETIQTLHDFISDQVQPKLSPNSDTNILDEMLALRKDESIMNLRQYFTLSTVLLCLFDLSRSLFGVHVKEETVKSNIRAWNDDVKLFYLHDVETGEKVASFYLDPFKRRDKAPGAFAAPIVFKQKIKQHDTLPVVAISLNIDQPAWDDLPVQMTLENVTTLFHEFGHALQHMLAKSKFGSFAGAHCIDEDTTELVSQFMEYLVYEKSVLSIIARNSKGDTLPDDIVSKLQRSRIVEKSYELCHRIFLSQLEIEIFLNFDPNGDETIIALQSRLAEKYCHFDPPPKGNIDPLIEIFQNNANGKEVAQYRYLWSEVMSADAYDHITCNEGKDLKLNGRKFCEAFLLCAGSTSTEKSFQNFRGREPFLEPYLKMLDIEKND